MRINGREGVLGRQGYRELVAWQKGMELVTAVYQATSAWPREEQFGLTTQVRRAAVAIPSNLAEGHGRTGSREFAHHVSIAFGSLCELETQLLIADQLGYATSEATADLMDLVAHIRRLLLGLLRSLKSTPTPPRTIVTLPLHPLNEVSPPPPPSPPLTHRLLHITSSFTIVGLITS